ncbi:glyoxal oxidase N-terminus-domain-containing protein [Auriculariales sp. MPI-PUGE-AT-0066]|nr:glyoxal oxidase N-terminus-domain-containing protein [Auriculariales sp. MPI-PUGE-AT-0066]
MLPTLVTALLVAHATAREWSLVDRAFGPPGASELPTRRDHHRRAVPTNWTLTQNGKTGVSAMQLIVVSETQAIVIDRVEHNTFKTSNGKPAWAALYGLDTHVARAVNVLTNTFCAGGGFLGNGTLVSISGNVPQYEDIDPISGWQGIRLFDPSKCSDSAASGSCTLYENPKRLRISEPRWYPTTIKLEDGSMIVMGGTKFGNFKNTDDTAANSLEYYPAKNIAGQNGLPVPSKFLRDTMYANLFPLMHLLPDGRLFVAANTKAMIYDWKNNKETRLPNIPNGVRVTYPFAGSSVLLPLRPSNNYTATILICGGSTTSDRVDPSKLSSQNKASKQCERMTLNDAGIAKGWETEWMSVPRHMPNLIVLPTGKVLIVNGAQTGYSGYNDVPDTIGNADSDHPAFTPILYNPLAVSGSRMSSTGLPTSKIARMYHSTASLLPSGAVLVAGSNPNEDVETEKYQTEYRAEELRPGYMASGVVRPAVNIAQGMRLNWNTAANVTVTLPKNWTTIQGLHTPHIIFRVKMGQRLVELVVVQPAKSTSTSTAATYNTTLSLTGPPNAKIFPPGPAFLYVLADGVPSTGRMLSMGDGRQPPVNQGAIDNMLAQTDGPE